MGDLADPDNQDLDAGKLLVPAPDTLLTLHPISTDVNKVANDDPHLIDPIDPAVGTLFAG